MGQRNEYIPLLTRAQQRVLQSSILVSEQLMEVQQRLGVYLPCRIEVMFAPLVTAWAEGKTWNEVLELSDLAPGDLARILHRTLDALRQFSNLPFHPVRRIQETGGIHPDIKTLCKEAVKTMDRYPLKDPLPFDEEAVESKLSPT